MALLLLIPAAGCGGLRPVTRVVLVTLDTTRADRLGFHGYAAAATPRLDALASESVVFDAAVAPTVTTLPSHSTLFTGLYPSDHGVRYNVFFKLEDRYETLAEIFQEAGWATAAFPASRILARPFGLAQGFTTYDEPAEDGPVDPEHPLAGAVRSAGEGVDLASRWLDAQKSKNSFLWLHVYDPHAPYAPPFPYSDRFRDHPYDGELAYVDREVGRLIDHLRADVAWRDTLLIVVGDHGEGLFDHGERWHATLVFESTLHVPLIVRSPGARATRVTEPVTLADLMPTILDLAGLPVPSPIRGVSLREVLRGQRALRREIYFEALAGSLIYGWQELRGVRAGRWKLIDSGEPELYDLEVDPAEQTNLVATEATRMAELREILAELSQPLGGASGARANETPELDPETAALLSSLGYVGGTGAGEVADGAPHPRKMIDLEPELLSAQSSVGQGQWNAVEEFCRYTLKRDPTNKWALIHMTRALLALDRFDEALEHAQLMPRIFPENEHGLALLAEVYLARDEPAAAEAALRRALTVLPNSERLRYLSLVLAFELGHSQVACREGVSAALAEHSGSARLLVLRARCEALEGRVAEAIATLGQATEAGFQSLGSIEGLADFREVVAHPAFAEMRATRTARSAGQPTRR